MPNAPHSDQQATHANQQQQPADTLSLAQSNYAPNEGNQPDSSSNRAADRIVREPKAWHRKWRNWKKAIAISNLLVAGAIATFTGVQWSVTGGQLKVMQIEQRPWVTISPAKQNIRTGPGDPLTIDTTLRNTGKTPAWIDRYEGTIVYDRDGGGLVRLLNDPDGVFKSSNPRRALIHPGHTQDIPGRSTGTMTLEEIRKVNSGEAKIYYLAVVEYQDSAGTPHWTTACYLFNPTDNSIIIYTEYNDADRYENERPPTWTRKPSAPKKN